MEKEITEMVLGAAALAVVPNVLVASLDALGGKAFRLRCRLHCHCRRLGFRSRSSR